MWQLFQFPLCPFSRKVRLVLAEKGVGHELVRENPWERRDEFMDLNPAGETPVMVELDQGVTLIGSQPIVEYFDETVDRMPMIHGNAALRAEIRRMTEWFDMKLYREAVEPLMNERMRKRLVNRETPDTRILREAMRTASEHLDYLDYLLDHRRWLAGPGLSLADFTAAAHCQRNRLSRRARLARAQANQGLVRSHEVAPLLPAASCRADGGNRSAGPL